MTPQERELLTRLIDSQMRVEMAVARLASPATFGLSPLLMRASHEDVLNSPLVFDREERLEMGEKLFDATVATKKKVRRKVSPYQKQFGKQLKILKKKHPRTKIGTLMKRAHRATKKAMK